MFELLFKKDSSLSISFIIPKIALLNSVFVFCGKLLLTRLLVVLSLRIVLLLDDGELLPSRSLCIEREYLLPSKIVE
jgi:hypothetical protein